MGGAATIRMSFENPVYAEPGVRSHCIRVAAFAEYAATALDVNPDLRAILLDSCRLHHLTYGSLKTSAMNRLLTDITGKHGEGDVGVNPDTAAVLRVWAGNAESRDRNQETLLLASILDASNTFDECFESLPYDPRPAAEVIDEYLNELIAAPLAKVFRTLRCVDEQTLSLAIEQANVPPPSVHALDVAVRARQLGEGSALAYDAGLLHDCGMAARASFGEIAQTNLIHWQQAGFPSVYCERLITGSDHADWGARMLERIGKVSKDVVDAVRGHHRPEASDSKLAAVLYLAEEEAGGEEDLPSAARVHIATRLVKGV